MLQKSDARPRGQGQLHSQTVYGLTNLSLKQAPAGRLLELVRRPWAIEHRVHRRRDVTDAEKITARSAKERLLWRWPHATSWC